jgi:hypothetical protein
MAQLVKILSQNSDKLYLLSISGDDVVLAREDPRDKTQVIIKTHFFVL